MFGIFSKGRLVQVVGHDEDYVRLLGARLLGRRGRAAGRDADRDEGRSEDKKHEGCEAPSYSANIPQLSYCPRPLLHVPPSRPRAELPDAPPLF